MLQVGDSFHVLILILLHLVVEHEGVDFFFLFINGVFRITNILVALVLTIAFFQDNGDQIVCFKISLVFVLGCVLTNISAPPFNYIPKVIPS